MNTIRLHIWLIIASLFLGCVTYAQTNSTTDSTLKSSLEDDARNDTSSLYPSSLLLLGISPVAYKGDLVSHYDKFGIAFNVGIRFNKKKRTNGELEVIAGFTTAQNSDYSFNGDKDATPSEFAITNFAGASYNLNFNLISKENFKLYLSQGLGLMRFSPRDENYDRLNSQLSTRAVGEDFSNITTYFPTRLGFLYLLPGGYGAGFQMSWLNPSTDYLDNISQWGNIEKSDKLLSYRFAIFVPLKK